MKVLFVISYLSFAVSAFDLPLGADSKLKLNNHNKNFTLAADQKLECYDEPDCVGIKITIGRDPVSDLSQDPYFFDNRIQSCRYNGIYNLYDGINYNQDNLEGAVYGGAWGEGLCVDMNDFSNKASSIRLVGAPNGWRYSTINFYEGQFYNGMEQYFFGDSGFFEHDNFGRSMIITGCSPWTIYESALYKGQSACFYPSDTELCYPSFFPDDKSMNGWANQISSVRLGCFSERKIYGKQQNGSTELEQKSIFGEDGKTYNKDV